ncbi:unnamed protein product, partial [Effrenium voratum]
ALEISGAAQLCVVKEHVPASCVEGSAAAFAAPGPGARLRGGLRWAGHGCESDLPSLSEHRAEILLLRRGRCSFAQKASVAAKRGALAAAVLDFEGAATGQAEALGRFGRLQGCRASGVVSQALSELKSMRRGTPGERHLVPLLLLPGAASTLLEATGDLEVELSWGQPAAAATLDLWLPFSAGAAALLKELAPAAGQLGDALQVRPHWRVVALDPAETAGAGAARRCARGLSELCADSETGTAEDLEQAVRLHCVARRHPKLWWQYVESESA